MKDFFKPTVLKLMVAYTLVTVLPIFLYIPFLGQYIVYISPNTWNANISTEQPQILADLFSTVVSLVIFYFYGCVFTAIIHGFRTKKR